MIGKRIEKLVVVDSLTGSKVNCLCDCGKSRVVSVGHFNTGKIKSCGCHKVSHGHGGEVRSREYISYHNMIARCTKPSNKRFKDYGGVGISVCKPWIDSFVNFISDMGDCPDGYQIDRIDNNLGYCKDNCRWVSRKENQANRSNSIIYTVNGQEYASASEASLKLQVSVNTIAAWCGKRKRKAGGYYPAKQGCSFRYKYEETQQKLIDKDLMVIK